MSDGDGTSPRGAWSGGTGRLAGLAAIAGGLLLIVGLIGFPELPTSDTPAPDVYTFFLDENGDVGRAAALMMIGLLLALVMFGVLRALLAGRRASAAPAAAMLALAQLGLGLQVVALAMLEILSLRPSEADPATSRAMLDLAEVLTAASGGALALALVAAAGAIRATQPGPLPRRFGLLTLIAAIGPGLWAVRLWSDAGSFDADSLLGSSVGWILFLAWLIATGAWLLSRGPGTASTPRPAAEPAPAPAAPPPAANPSPSPVPPGEPRSPRPEPRGRRAERFETRPRPENSSRLTPRPPAREGAGRRFEPPPPLQPSLEPAPILDPDPDPESEADTDVQDAPGPPEDSEDDATAGEELDQEPDERDTGDDERQ